jgi:protein-disulfide isomerase
MTTRWWIVCAGVGSLWLALGTAAAQTTPLPTDAAATVGDDVITMAELQQSAAGELANLEQQRQRLLDQKLNQLIVDRLLAREAKKRGVTVDTLLRDEVLAKVPKVPDADVAEFMTQNRARLPQGNEIELKAKVADYLQRQQANKLRDTYVASLRAQTPVQVHLKAPEPIRVQIDPGQGYARGPREAPVNIVEFSDFRCPFCKEVVPKLKQLATQYPDRVRWVFRDFPIPGLHPDAPLAHEAARCAGEQGKFWPYHDLLFERAMDVSVMSLKQYAAEVGADRAAFDQCLDSHKYQGAVNADIEAGTKVGVTGTPTFFINGEAFVGNQPLGEFQRIIERELARTAAKR